MTSVWQSCIGPTTAADVRATRVVAVVGYSWRLALGHESWGSIGCTRGIYRRVALSTTGADCNSAIVQKSIFRIQLRHVFPN